MYWPTSTAGEAQCKQFLQCIFKYTEAGWTRNNTDTFISIRIRWNAISFGNVLTNRVSKSNATDINFWPIALCIIISTISVSEDTQMPHLITTFHSNITYIHIANPNHLRITNAERNSKLSTNHTRQNNRITPRKSAGVAGIISRWKKLNPSW